MTTDTQRGGAIRRYLSTVALLVVLPSSAYSQLPAATDAAVQAIRAAERGRFEAMTRGDVNALRSMLAADLTHTHTTGAVDSRASLLESLRTKALVYEAITPADVDVRVFGSTAIATGLSRMQVRAGGRVQRFRIRFLEVYLQRDGRWQLVAWQSTRLPTS